MPRCLRVLLISAVALACCAQMAGADPAPAPSAFAFMPTTGVSLSPTGFSNGVPNRTYTLTLSSDASITWNGTRYQIVSIWGFFAVNKTSSDANDFTAAGSDIGEWKWDQKPTNGDVLSVAGWFDANKNEAMLTPSTGSVSKQFAYSQFSASGAMPLLGLHVSVSIPNGVPSPFGSGATGNIIPQTVPEPAAIFGVLSGMIGLGVLPRRRTH